MKKEQFDQFQKMLATENISQCLLTKIRAYFGALQQARKFDELHQFIHRLDLVVTDFVDEYSSKLES